MESLAFISIFLLLVVSGFLVASHIFLRREISTHEDQLGDLVSRLNSECKRSQQADAIHSSSLKKQKRYDVKINTMLKDGLANVNTRSNDINSQVVEMERKQKEWDAKLNFSTGLSAKGTLNVTGATAKVCIDGICMTKGDVANFKAAFAQLQQKPPSKVGFSQLQQKPHATTGFAQLQQKPPATTGFAQLEKKPPAMSSSCYDANNENNCYTCNDVLNAYRAKRLGYNENNFEQCRNAEAREQAQADAQDRAQLEAQAQAAHSATGCYGANNANNCSTCNDVINAYKARGWAYDQTKFKQCK
jgi:hypothetical protein